jgi:hypothetical protein
VERSRDADGAGSPNVYRNGVSPAGILERTGRGAGADWSPYLAVSHAFKPQTQRRQSQMLSGLGRSLEPA